MTEPVGGTGQGMKLHTKILLGLILGGSAGLAANLLLGSSHQVVAGLNTYLAQPVGRSS